MSRQFCAPGSTKLARDGSGALSSCRDLPSRCTLYLGAVCVAKVERILGRASKFHRSSRGQAALGMRDTHERPPERALSTRDECRAFPRRGGRRGDCMFALRVHDIQGRRDAAGGRALQPNEAIVVLKKPQLEGVGTEENFLDCLQENRAASSFIPSRGRAQEQAPGRHAVQDLWRAGVHGRAVSVVRTEYGALQCHRLKTLLDRPGVADKLSEIECGTSYGSMATRRRPTGRQRGLCRRSRRRRVYWYWMVGSTRTTSRRSGTCSPRRRRHVDRRQGTSVLIGALSRFDHPPVQSTACNRLAEQLRSFLVGDDLQGGPPAAAPAGGSARVEPAQVVRLQPFDGAARSRGIQAAPCGRTSG